ncbi:Uu.00g007320.m01.CDS01 [Anthostomella pinea]|uniref:Uu.00g007320.m01.CDS01 n=1 Tax=Anthostomella pinea TaxID=933095 RepID=A0AAI8VY77_9PEZI|nr:Uu.00g007320.m01.CDS01 [Anthostomella pinea]
MAPYDVSGKYAVVTGGGSGICLDFIKLLLVKGCSVIVGDLALRPAAEEVAKAYPHPPAAPGKASLLFHKTDVKSWPQLSSLWNTAVSTFPQVDIVVPGAGVYEPLESSFWCPPGVEGGPSKDLVDSEAGTYATFGINLIHPIRLSQLAISYWTTKKLPGNLLFVGSIAGYTATVGTPYYYSSKAGLHGFVMSLAPLHKRLGIRVACVAPGACRTPLWDQEHCKSKLTNNDPAVRSDFVADVMLNMCENDKYGDGQIVEVMDLGTAQDSKPSVREVPVHLLYPAASGVGVPTLLVEEEKLWKQLETEGFKA